MFVDVLEYALIGVTTLLMVILLFILMKIKNKSQIHYVFISMVTLLCIWNIGVALDKRAYSQGNTNMIFVSLQYFGTCFVPVLVLLTGMIFAGARIKFTYRHLFLLIIPVISMTLLITDDYHHLFMMKYSFFSDGMIFGKYFIIHAIYSYTLIFIGMCYLAYFSVKNSGIFSRQSVIILIGIFIPLIVNIVFTLRIFRLDQTVSPISFSFSIICFFIAIFKYDFLKVLPIAMQIVVDNISNSFVVIDLEYNIVDYNRTMVKNFGSMVEIKRKENIFKTLETIKSVNVQNLKGYIEEAHEKGKAIAFEHHIFEEGKLDKYFSVEITPIIHNKIQLGTLIMLTNISQHKKDMRIIMEQQQLITEKERLASLGNLMGGISHNLKTPIMSISGCITALEDLKNEYHESIGNPVVTANDHFGIVSDISSNITDLKGHVSYISNALTAIKNQVINPDSRNEVSFTLEEVILNLEFLMKYEIKTNYCSFFIDNKVGNAFMINGDVGTLVQIINNLISNSIQSYGKIANADQKDISKRKIELIISKSENYIVFEVKDYGFGIPPQIRDKLFKEMITSKGKDGTGIGLYLSYSKVKAMFNGDMWFESQEGKGTSFFVKVQPDINI